MVTVCNRVEHFVCQTGECGILDKPCCRVSSCDYGLECVDGKCHVGCGLLGEKCCSTGPQCLYWAAYYEGTCQFCPLGLIQVGNECRDLGKQWIVIWHIRAGIWMPRMGQRQQRTTGVTTCLLHSGLRASCCVCKMQL